MSYLSGWLSQTAQSQYLPEALSVKFPAFHVRLASAHLIAETNLLQILYEENISRNLCYPFTPILLGGVWSRNVCVGDEK